jgi:5-bromo-4-chloroindolyl phosphate hydrolysis protein
VTNPELYQVRTHVFTNPQFSICNCVFEKIFVFFEKKNNICIGILYTLAKTEIIYPKNVRAKVLMDFT